MDTLSLTTEAFLFVSVKFANSALPVSRLDVARWSTVTCHLTDLLHAPIYEDAYGEEAKNTETAEFSWAMPPADPNNLSLSLSQAKEKVLEALKAQGFMLPQTDDGWGQNGYELSIEANNQLIITVPIPGPLVAPTPWFDLINQVEETLQSLVFHSDYPNSGKEGWLLDISTAFDIQDPANFQQETETHKARFMEALYTAGLRNLTTLPQPDQG